MCERDGGGGCGGLKGRTVDLNYSMLVLVHCDDYSSLSLLVLSAAAASEK